VRIDPDKPLFPISTVAEILGCPQKVLRLYEKNELIKPARTDGQRRLYSQRDIERLEFIHFITHVRRVNLAGAKVILDLLEHIPEDKWRQIVRGVENDVESMAERDREVFAQGRPELVRELEQGDDD